MATVRLAVPSRLVRITETEGVLSAFNDDPGFEFGLIPEVKGWCEQNLHHPSALLWDEQGLRWSLVFGDTRDAALFRVAWL